MRSSAKTVAASLALLGSVAGCSATTGTAISVSPISSAFVQPVAVRVPENMGSEDVLNLPTGALTSEVALLKSSGDEVCFDIKMRTWQGSVRRWNATLQVDGRELVSREIELDACTPNSLEPDEPARATLSCLAVDTAVSSLPTDALENVKVRGSRVCLQHARSLSTDSKEVRLELVQGAAKYSFRWALVAKPEVGTAVGVARAL